MKNEQLSLNGEINDEIVRMETQRRRMEEARNRAKLNGEYIRVEHREEQYMKTGQVVVYEQTVYERFGTAQKFYRCVAGWHKTVAGPALHVIAAPNEEWPEVPRWAYDEQVKCQWVYPSGYLYTKNIPEYEPDIKWKEG